MDVGKKFSTALAPMRGITSLGFIAALANFSRPGECVSEFLRVHASVAVPTAVIDLLENHRWDIPLHLQLLGRDPAHFVRVARLLTGYPIASINLNFGCPMPKIGKKGTGGILLTDLPRMDAIIAALLADTPIPISVKTRVGYGSSEEFPRILEHLGGHGLSALYLHARTVKGLYAEPVNFEFVKWAKAVLPYPVFANGDIKTAAEAIKAVEETGSDGVMVGRAALANPWIFRQIEEMTTGRKVFHPSPDDYLSYVKALENITAPTPPDGWRHASAMKKYVVPIADLLGGNGPFPKTIRHAITATELSSAFENFFAERG
jgi:tRNA-dihydrouridine synthase